MQTFLQKHGPNGHGQSLHTAGLLSSIIWSNRGSRDTRGWGAALLSYCCDAIRGVSHRGERDRPRSQLPYKGKAETRMARSTLILHVGGSRMCTPGAVRIRISLRRALECLFSQEGKKTSPNESRGETRLEIHTGGWKCDRSGTDLATTLQTSLNTKPQRVLDQLPTASVHQPKRTDFQGSLTCFHFIILGMPKCFFLPHTLKFTQGQG